jgi:hypothetical protein
MGKANFMKRIFILVLVILQSLCIYAQNIHRTLPAKRTGLPVKIDGILDDEAWKDAPAALGYTEFRPTPFKKEDSSVRTECYMLYNDEGIYISGFCHEPTKDSIAAELTGRDGFGTNDYIGVIFDTYNDKINGFEYFVTPYGEQWDAKMSPNPNGNSEDFSWNAVWKSAAVIRNDGWTFEIFIPFSAIRFSKKNIQDWGLNITRRRQKTQQQVTWNPIDVNVNGFLTQEGYWTGLENIKPPLRLQFSPYLSYYVNHYPFNEQGVKNWTASVNGGMDLKYGINQAMTLDMTLIPDFGQVQSDNQILNLTPFEVKYNENRPFFIEGTELFNKGNFFYSRRIGGMPLHHDDVSAWIGSNEHVVKNPTETKLINATKISGRLQSGLGIGFFNAVTNEEFATIEDDQGHQRKIQTSPLTNYNIIVLDQSLKHNSSITFINNSVVRSGKDYDADVTAGLFDLYDKSNTWNFSGKVAMSNLFDYLAPGKTITGYGHFINFGKSSGRFNFNIQQELTNDRFNNNDLGYITNNNYHNYYAYAGYHWTKPSNWYNNLYLNFNFNYSRRLQPDAYQNANINANINGQLKNLWQVGTVWGYEPSTNNFYEPHVAGRVFKGWSDWFNDSWVKTNFAKRYGVSAEVMYVSRSMFHSKRYSLSLQQSFRFNKRFSIGYNLNLAPQTNNVGFATIDTSSSDIVFGRRDIQTVENIFNVKYSFNNKMVFTARVRHYWSRLDYKELFTLQQGGGLQDNTTYKGDVNPDYNDFTVDAVFTWEFAPGSFINAVWKNNTNYSMNTVYGALNSENYFRNFNHVMDSPQNNNFSVKVIYFLDYLQLKNLKKKKEMYK